MLESAVGRGSSESDGSRQAENSKTVDNALMLLNVLGDHGPISVAGLTRITGLKSTPVRRLLNTLHAQAFVLKMTDGYVLGPSLSRLGERVAPVLRCTVTPFMQRLGEAVGETVLCHVQQGTKAVILTQVTSTRWPVRCEESVGRFFPLHEGAGARALLAAWPEQEVKRYLKSIDEPERVVASLKKAKELGFYYSHGEREPGVSSIAAAVMGERSKALCSISVIVPDQRANTLKTMVRPLLSTVEALTEQYRVERREGRLQHAEA